MREATSSGGSVPSGQMARAPGLSVRLKLTLSYAAFLMVAGALLLGAVWLFLLRYVPRGETVIAHNPGHLFIAPGRGELARSFAPAAVASGMFLLVFGLVGGWLLSGRMLAPLRRITEATRLAASGSLSHRIELSGRDDELRELADAFDAMLTRLEADVVAQEQFTANASHELRTPLAITQTLLEAARGRNLDATTTELVDRLHAVNARAIDLTEALLVLSRADQRSFTLAPVDLSLVAEEATETLAPLADKHGITLEVRGEPAPALGSETLLVQLVSNLVHNAIVHNLAVGGSVWVRTLRGTGGTALVVENTGEVLEPAQLRTFTEPFRRGAERIHTDHAGVGLGLAIVASITQAHDGTLTLAPREGGGLIATVRLPAGPRATG